MIHLKNIIVLLLLGIIPTNGHCQDFYLGADMSYVNEMEHCGVEYSINDETRDPYQLMGDFGANLARFRLWHSPAWYESLNDGTRFSDLNDIKLAISRAKERNMEVLLAPHLSDNWADPGKQLVPDAWLPVVDNVETLKDSLYNYYKFILDELYVEDLLPTIIQIGNETDKGILLSPEDNQGWVLDWPRNRALFNEAIKAIRDFNEEASQDVKIMIHVTSVSAESLIGEFHENGVVAFDYIGVSYYWQWHQPTSIADLGTIISSLKESYPDKEVMIVESGYPWTTDWFDDAGNILGEAHPDYPLTPEGQKNWLIDLTQEAINAKASGVLYWEPLWVSNECSTQWGSGSHYENATFFDFSNQVIETGGISWLNHPYDFTSSADIEISKDKILEFSNLVYNSLEVNLTSDNSGRIEILDLSGNRIYDGILKSGYNQFDLTAKPAGMYVLIVRIDGAESRAYKIVKTF